MQVRYVNYEDYQFCYSYRGRPGYRPSILMLHGFSAHKDMWLSIVKVGFCSSCHCLGNQWSWAWGQRGERTAACMLWDGVCKVPGVPPAPCSVFVGSFASLLRAGQEW